MTDLENVMRHYCETAAQPRTPANALPPAERLRLLQQISTHYCHDDALPGPLCTLLDLANGEQYDIGPEAAEWAAENLLSELAWEMHKFVEHSLADRDCMPITAGTMTALAALFEAAKAYRVADHNARRDQQQPLVEARQRLLDAVVVAHRQAPTQAVVVAHRQAPTQQEVTI